MVDGAPFAQPEGSADDWKAVITSMKEGKDNWTARRVGLIFRNGYAGLYSPRNSMDDDDNMLIAPDEILGWIANAEALLKAEAHEVESGEGI